MTVKTLNDKIETALGWAREAAETQRAQCDSAGEDSLVPSWLPELEAALLEIDRHEETEEEHAQAVGAHEAMKEHHFDKARATASPHP